MKPNQSNQKRVQPQKGKKESTPSGNPLFYLFTGFLILFIPVFHLNDAMDITLMPRTMALGLFLLVFSLIIFGKVHFPKYQFTALRSWLFPVVLGYLLITIISVVWAVNHRESFFDMARTTLFLYVLGFAAVMFTTVEDWKERTPKLVAIASLIAFVIGIVQYYNKVFLESSSTLPDGRETIYAVIGVMSHKNEFSNALMLMLPFLGYGAYSFKKTWRFISIAALVLTFVMILILKTRAVWVGIAGAGFLISAMLVFFGNRVKLHRTWRMVVAGVMIAGIAGIAYIYALPEQEDDFSLLGRVKNITNLQSAHNTSRIKVWQATVEMIRENPWKGVGAGNWQMLIAPYCKGMFSSIAALNWGRPHNDFLWVWAEKGIIGIILYLAIFGLGLFYLFRAFFRHPDVKARMLALLFIGGIISYLAISFFSFPYERINHTVYLALMMAGAITLNHGIIKHKPFQPRRTTWLLISLLLLGFSALYGYKATMMEYSMKKTIAAENRGRFEEAIQYANESKNAFRSLNPMAYPPEYYVAKSDYQIGKQLIERGDQDAGLNRYQMSLEGFEHTLELFPGNVWTISRMGLIYNDLGSIYEARGEKERSREQYLKMLKNLQYMLELVPNLVQERKAMAGVYFRLGEYQKAIETLKMIPNYKKNKEIMTNIQGLEDLIRKNEE